MASLLFLIEIGLPTLFAWLTLREFAEGDGFRVKQHHVKNPHFALALVLIFGTAPPLITIIISGVWWGIIWVPIISFGALVLLETPGIRYVRNLEQKALDDAKDAATVIPPTTEIFTKEFTAQYDLAARRQAKRILIPAFRDQLIEVIADIYHQEFWPITPAERHRGRTESAYKTFFDSFQASLLSFTLKVPAVATVPIDHNYALIAHEIIALTNKHRTAAGLLPLQEDGRLGQSAYAKAQYMRANGQLTHVGPDGRDWTTWLTNTGYQYETAAENLAATPSDEPSAIVRLWMESPTHKANILNPSVTQIGVGVVNGLYEGRNSYYAVQHFAKPLANVRTDPFVCSTPLVFMQRGQMLEFYNVGRNGEPDWASPEIEQAYKALVAPLKSKFNKRMQSAGLFNWREFIGARYPKSPEDNFLSLDYDEEANERAWNKWLEDNARIEASIPPLKRNVATTPYFGRELDLMPQNIFTETPVTLDDETRFRHQWIIGDTGAGKTTFISSMIESDLRRVAAGEASLFVMDSQNELIPDIANLKLFSPGQPLEGKLIYLEPDADYPLHLNIFDFDKERLKGLNSNQRAMLARGSEEMVLFFMRSLVRADVSGHMETILKYAFRAVELIPDATVFTLSELLRKGGFAKYRDYLSALDEDDKRFLAEDLFTGEFSASLGGMRARLAALTADKFFKAMFSQPRNTFDLFNELQSSKVILINTKKALLRGATEPFGRFFITKLLQATEERMVIGRGARLPVFAYIDEAGDYISEEENIAELIDKARKQKVGLIIANQREEHIKSANVLDAMSRVAIKAVGQAAARPHEPPNWTLTVSGGEPIPVSVRNVRFQDQLRMSSGEYADMLSDMRRRFSNTSAPSKAPSAAEDKGQDGDTNPKPWRNT